MSIVVEPNLKNISSFVLDCCSTVFTSFRFSVVHTCTCTCLYFDQLSINSNTVHSVQTLAHASHHKAHREVRISPARQKNSRAKFRTKMTAFQNKLPGARRDGMDLDTTKESTQQLSNLGIISCDHDDFQNTRQVSQANRTSQQRFTATNAQGEALTLVSIRGSRNNQACGFLCELVF